MSISHFIQRDSFIDIAFFLKYTIYYTVTLFLPKSKTIGSISERHDPTPELSCQVILHGRPPRVISKALWVLMPTLDFPLNYDLLK